MRAGELDHQMRGIPSGWPKSWPRRLGKWENQPPEHKLGPSNQYQNWVGPATISQIIHGLEICFANVLLLSVRHNRSVLGNWLCPQRLVGNSCYTTNKPFHNEQISCTRFTCSKNVGIDFANNSKIGSGKLLFLLDMKDTKTRKL